MYSFSGSYAASVPHIHVSVSDLYIPGIGPQFSCSKIGRSIVGISIFVLDAHYCTVYVLTYNYYIIVCLELVLQLAEVGKVSAGQS
jgi:hypothetical protein